MCIRDSCHAALVQGTIENVAAHGDVLTYERHYRERSLFVALNFGGEASAFESRPATVLLSTAMGRDGGPLTHGTNALAAGEALVASM